MRTVAGKPHNRRPKKGAPPRSRATQWLLRAVLSMALILTPLNAWAATTDTLDFQGYLTDLAGTPINNATQGMTIRICDAATAGSCFWSEDHTGATGPTVAIENGSFFINLGVVAPLPAAITNGTYPNLYLEVEIQGETPMTPRFAMTSATTALFAKNAGDVNGVPIHPSAVFIGVTPVIDSGGNWVGPSVAGAAGATGASGTPGAIGLTGASGATGATGASGDPGSVGPLGNPGVTGASGASGNTGAQGASGSTGATGGLGATGGTGGTGAIGASGATGGTGSTGANGASGETGATGSPGAIGQSGATGATGAPGPDCMVGGYCNLSSPGDAVMTLSGASSNTIYFGFGAGGPGTPGEKIQLKGSMGVRAIGDTALGTDGTGGMWFNTASGSQFDWLANGTSMMVLDSSGSLGIGNSFPTAKLHINGGGVVGIRVETTGGTAIDIPTGFVQNGIRISSTSSSSFIHGVYSSVDAPGTGGPGTQAAVYAMNAAADGRAVFGKVSGISGAVAIQGTSTSATSYAGFFSGKVHIASGSLNLDAISGLTMNGGTFSMTGGSATFAGSTTVNFNSAPNFQNGLKIGPTGVVITSSRVSTAFGPNFTGPGCMLSTPITTLSVAATGVTCVATPEPTFYSMLNSNFDLSFSCIIDGSNQVVVRVCRTATGSLNLSPYKFTVRTFE